MFLNYERGVLVVLIDEEHSEYNHDWELENQKPDWVHWLYLFLKVLRQID